MAGVRGRGRRAGQLGMRKGWKRDFPTKKKPRPGPITRWLRSVFGAYPGGDRYSYTLAEARKPGRRRRR